MTVFRLVVALLVGYDVGGRDWDGLLGVVVVLACVEVVVQLRRAEDRRRVEDWESGDALRSVVSREQRGTGGEP